MKQKRHNIKRYSFIQLYLIFKDIFGVVRNTEKEGKLYLETYLTMYMIFLLL